MLSDGDRGLKRSIHEHTHFRRSGSPNALIVFTHGLTASPESYEELLTSLMGEEAEPFASADLLPYKFKSGLMANTNLTKEAETLEARIRELHGRYDYEKIILVGHSVGGILVRAVVMKGHERDEGRGWVTAIDRLVLLASANRGFVARELYKRLMLRAANSFRLARLLRDVSRGSPWMNDLRLGWLMTFNQKGHEAPPTIQLRGTDDSVVSEYDSIDVRYFPNSDEQKLEGVDHREFIGMTCEHAAYARIRDAFTECLGQPEAPVPAAETTRTIVFLIHGIRDFGEWQDSLAFEIEKECPQARVVSVRYGYFNIFQFLLWFQRKRAVRAFVDRYIQTIATEDRHTKIEIAVAAHSNGTYVVANAMKSYRQIIVNRIYLAGSVLPRRFDWSSLDPKQVRELELVRNDCANWDWAVGFLCAGLRPLFFPWLGITGYRGFHHEESSPVIKDNLYLQGGHGAAFTPNRHAVTAGFLLKGEPRQLGRVAPPSALMNFLHYAALGLIPIVVVGLALVYLLWFPSFDSDVLKVLASAAFTLCLILVLVRI